MESEKKKGIEDRKKKKYPKPVGYTQEHHQWPAEKRTQQKGSKSKSKSAQSSAAEVIETNQKETNCKEEK